MQPKDRITLALSLSVEGLRRKELLDATGLSSRTLYKYLTQLIEQGRVIKEHGAWLERPNPAASVFTLWTRVDKPQYIKSLDTKIIPIDIALGAPEDKLEVAKRISNDPLHGKRQLDSLRKNSGRWSEKALRYRLKMFY